MINDEGGHKTMIQKVLVLSQGGPLASQVARMIRQAHVYCEVMSSGIKAETVRAENPIGLVYAGDRFDRYPVDPAVRRMELPMLSIENAEDAEALESFLFCRCNARADFTAERFIEDAVQAIREKVGTGRVLLGLSGGVDSSVVAALLHRAIGNRLDCVFVNHGLMRKGEPEEVAHVFSRLLPVNLVTVDAGERFLRKLDGVDDPEHKRKIIGAEFIQVFTQEARKLGVLNFFAQGTIYPDIIESGAIPGEGVIKSHHNVGGLPDDIRFDGIVEPLKMLFKDEVRAVGRALSLPKTIINRQPFPGPGLAVRVVGALTREKVETVREADFIFRDELDRAGILSETSQCFAVLTGVQSVGIRNNIRAYEHVIALRAVSTTDFMTADWTPIPYDVLRKVSERITAEVQGVGRVVLDVTGKPPASIEWE